MSQLNLSDEIKKAKEELGGPFFNVSQNKQYKRRQQELLLGDDASFPV